MNECFNCPLGNLLKSKPHFTKEERTVVATKIGEYLVNNLIKPKPDMFVEMVNQLIVIFPHESGFEEEYYKKDKNNKPSGLLFVKYAKAARNNKALIQNVANIIEIDDDETLDVHVHSENEEISESIEWLERNRNPTRDLSFDLRNHWLKTSQRRFPKSNEIEKWPHYKLTIGYELINIDFKYHFKEATNFGHDDALKFMGLLPKIKANIKSSQYKARCDSCPNIENEGM